MFSDSLKQLTVNRRFKAFAIAIFVLIVLAILQVNNLKKQTPMAELISGCNLQTTDLQRMQIALSQAGLSEFRMEENRLLVPTAERAKYLQALAEQNAIPGELRDEEPAENNINPFMSRAQQLALERAEKKRQIRDMVMRLPFVEQAWFQMDLDEVRSAFRKPDHSAVVSVRPPLDGNLTDHQANTIKQMVSGAVSGLAPAQIVVIDLSSGYAHHDENNPEATEQIRLERLAFEQKRQYEIRIREALRNYQGLNIRVDVAVNEEEQASLVAESDLEETVSTIQQVSATSTQPAVFPAAGANGVASIDDFPSPQPAVITPVQVAEVTQPVRKKKSFRKNVQVAIDVPQTLVYQVYGPPAIARSSARNQSEFHAAVAHDTNVKFEQLKSEIIQKVQPLIADTGYQNQSMVPVTVNLVRESLDETPAWMITFKNFAQQNWPSLAVLVIGLVLLSLVHRNEPQIILDESPRDETHGHDEVTFSAPHAQQSVEPEPGNAEVRLSKLIEKDPDAAAKVIQQWIRDAA